MNTDHATKILSIIMLLLEEEEEEEALIDEAITQLQQTINNTAAVLGFLAQPPNYPRILSNSLLPVSESAFRHFYLNAEPGSFEKYLRFDRATFGDILERIRDLYSVITVRARKDPSKACSLREQKRVYTPEQALGLFLRYIAAGTSSDDQVLAWGGSSTSRSRYLNLMLLCVFVALRKWDKAEIKVPTEATAREWARLIENYEPRLRGCFGFADGKIVPLQHDSRWTLQNLYYNGMDKVHAVKLLTAFGASGEIFAFGANYPSTFHDSKTTTSLGLTRALQQFPTNLWIATDTAFPASPHVRRKLTENETATLSTQDANDAELLGSVLSRVRCGSEWGNGGMDKCFQILTQPLPCRRDKWRAMLLEVIARLWNVRTRCMGVNQIATVFRD